ncbi:MAG: thioredoxin family protein [Myxococcaceae bacterium]|nr:thioredoxin family protein [Myxococcaceae bacterium]
MDIKILGKGCAKCLKLEEMTKQALAKLGRQADVTHVSDLDAITQYDVMSTPALVIDGVVKVQGHLPRREDLEAWLS